MKQSGPDLLAKNSSTEDDLNVSESTSNGPRTKHSTASLVAMDLALTLGTLFSLKYLLLQSPVMWTFAGPVSLVASLCVATWRLKRNNESWRELGLTHNTSHLNLILWALGALIVTILAGGIAASLAVNLLGNAEPVSAQASDFMQNRFANVPGNLPVYLYWIAVSWIIGGFTEELLFRGFLISRFEKLFSKFPFPVVFAVLFQALIFGQQHMYYQGVIGLVETGMIAIISGAIYILSKRRLWPLIISHGLANTLGMTIIFLNGPI